MLKTKNNNSEFKFGSLHYGRLYLASYNLIDKKIDLLTSFNTGNRVRDIVKLNSKNFIGVFEDPARIAFITISES